MGKKIHLVLGSGGARGMAHIGVIEAIEAAGYTICSVTGSSIGAVVGAMYCAGHLTTYRDWLYTLSRTSVLRLFDFTFAKNGFVKGQKVYNRLQSFTGDLNIEDLAIPFTAVATDIHQQEEVYFSSGNLYDALRASTAIPGVFTPVNLRNRWLVDGAVLNPLPLNLVQRDPDTLVIAVSLNGVASVPAPATEKVPKAGLIDMLNTSYDLTQQRLIQLMIEKYQPDILVEVPRNVCNGFDFHKAREVVEAGKIAFERVNAVQASGFVSSNQ
jgi:NTE family protein